MPFLLRAAALPLLLAALAAPAVAQPDSLSARPLPPFLVLTGRVTADSVRFLGPPGEVRVRFTGDVADTLARADVENVPRPVQPGATYRDVRVHFEVRTRLADVQRLVDELLRPRAVPPDSLRSPSGRRDR